MEPQDPLLRVSAVEWLPWVKIDQRGDGSLQLGGMMAYILKALSISLKFKYEIVVPSDGRWGGLLPNGTWTGMIAMLVREEADIALGPFSIYPERAAVTDLTTPIHHGSIGLMTQRPRIKNDIDGFLKPFTFNVWLASMLSLLAIGLSLGVIEKAERKVYDFVAKRDLTSKALLWSIKAFTQEGSEWLPRKNAARLVVATWLLASLIFMSSYSGILVAMLTAPLVTIPIDSLEDLVSQSEIPWKLSPPGTLSHDYLKESEYEVHQLAYRGKIGTLWSCWEKKEDIASGKYAATCPAIAMKKVISWDFSTKGYCRLYMARKMYYTQDPNSIAFRKNSSFLVTANHVLNSLKESGIMNFWMSQQLNNITHCMRPPSTDKSSNENDALNMEALGGCFIVLVAGHVLGIWMFLCEHILLKLQEKKRQEVLF